MQLYWQRRGLGGCLVWPTDLNLIDLGVGLDLVEGLIVGDLWVDLALVDRGHGNVGGSRVLTSRFALGPFFLLAPDLLNLARQDCFVSFSSSLLPEPFEPSGRFLLLGAYLCHELFDSRLWLLSDPLGWLRPRSFF